MTGATSIGRVVATAAWMLVGTIAAVAQYSVGAQSLKKASELHDERGFASSKAITVDGRLSVAPSNGGIAYSYPLARRTVHGFPIDVALNYCGSVAFSTYTRYETGDMGAPYSRWGRFHENRPAWIIGVNGFAMQVLSHASSYHCSPTNTALSGAGNRRRFSDSDFVWIVDGYDACNRMDRLTTTSQGSHFVDVIRILRDDGTLLELVNSRPATSVAPENRGDLFAGYYRVNEANARGYGIVEYDSTYWPLHIRRFAQDAERYDFPLYPFIPRRLRYFPGDGLEYLFREWVTPYGLQAYADSSSRFGGMFGGPTIFYLEEIRHNDIVLTRAQRSRHYPVTIDEPGRPILDSTKGRALFTGLDNVCELLYGKRSIAVEAGGRTVQISFDTMAIGGSARWSEHIPLAQFGYAGRWTAALAALSLEDMPYRSQIAYVNRIIDPAGRTTRFRYESHRRCYRDFGFPYVGIGVEVATRNWRLIEIDEPTARYEICYRDDDPRSPSLVTGCATGTAEKLLAYGLPSADNPALLTNMVRRVRKLDHDGSLLVTDDYTLGDYNGATGCFEYAQHERTDERTKTIRRHGYRYARRALPPLHPYAPAPVFTELRGVSDEGGGVRTETTTHHQRPTSSDYFWLPTSSTVTVNGVRKLSQTTEYELDTVRRYGSDAPLTAACGWEVTRAVTRTNNPDGSLRLVDTTYYRHFAMRDTVALEIARFWRKHLTIRRFLSLLHAPDDTILKGRRWEEVMYDPAVAVYERDTVASVVHRTPHFGVVERTTTSDADGHVLSGSRVVLRGTASNLLDRGAVALPIADSLIGRGAVRSLLRSTLGYGTGWTRNHPVVRTDANGARTLIAYDSIRDESARTVALSRLGTKLTDDDSIRADVLRGIAPELIEQPIAEARLVRKADAAGSLVVDTAVSELERSFFGLVSGVRDANGWMTRSQYDRNGRLTATWLPGDYPRVGPIDTFMYDGPDSIDLFGVTTFTRAVDTLRCTIARTRPPTYPRTVSAGTEPVIDTDPLRLYAGLPVLRRPLCPCGGDTGSVAESKGGPGLMEDCIETMTYPMLGEYPGYRGHLFYRVDRRSILHSMVRLDSAFLRLYVANVEGECVSVRVSIPALGFARAYLFNCEGREIDDGNGGGGNLPGLHGYVPSTRGVPTVQGPYFDIRLDSTQQRIAALRLNDTVGVEIRVTSPGTGIRFASGAAAADVRPKLILYGRYRTLSDTVDYTLAYRHVDDSLMTEVMAKTDDLAHTSSEWTVNRYHGDIRRSRIRHYFGADYRLRFSEIAIGEPVVPLRIDTVSFDYTGSGTRSVERDQNGSAVRRTFDAYDRPVAIEHQDGSEETIEYLAGTPADCGIVEDGQDFLGFASASIATDEAGIRRARYFDAFDRLRREVSGLGTLDLTTRYDYDLLGRITRVVNPNGDTTRYWYDDFGRVSYRSHPDLGIVSFAYDDAGNVRFSQSADQAARRQLTYNQYDDRGRVTLVGEATIDATTLPGGARVVEAPTDDDGLRKESMGGRLMAGGHENAPPGIRRLTDELDGAEMHAGMPSDDVSTINGSIWQSPQRTPPPRIWTYGAQTLVILGCQLRPTALLGETRLPSPPYISHPIGYYDPVTLPAATMADFENVARYPHFPLLAMHYDTLPPRLGAIWSAAPSEADWDSIAPRGRLRNLKGREAAVAWREHGGEPWSFATHSYDERGRVEALLRYTDNVGFDAVYYRYNSLNQITLVSVADPLNLHTTWYGYDRNGRLDTVWTLLEKGRGLGLGSPRRPALPRRPRKPDIVYSYTRTGHVATMSYPPASLRVAYAYSARKWIDSIAAHDVSQGPGAEPLFRQSLRYDARGLPTSQRSSFAGGTDLSYSYSHDAAERLTRWSDPLNAETYKIDRVGKRVGRVANGVWVRTDFGYGQPTMGPNRMLWSQSYDARGEWKRFDYTYDRDGAVAGRQRTDSSIRGIVRAPAETFTYSYRELLRRYTYNGTTHDWRYRYSPAGEREQKRLYPVNRQNPAASNENPWAYSLLGASGEELATWHGREVYQTQCSGVPIGTAWLYPVAYNCIGGGLTRVTTRPDGAAPNGTKEYLVADGLGSTRLVVGAGGAVLERIEYDPFGQARFVRPSVEQAYVGRRSDLESGLADHGVRKYEPAEGRFLSVDPKWESFRDVSPYLYSHASPLNRVDANGQWDIVVHVSKDRSQNGYGVAVVTNRKGEEVFRFSVRVEGVGDRAKYGSKTNPRDRAQTSGDTPLGIYDIPNGTAKWRSDGSRRSYGPQARLVLEGVSGEIADVGRTHIRIHGGRQEGDAAPALEKTQGCLRAYDRTMLQLKEVTDDLEESDPLEYGGSLTIVPDLEIRDGVPTVTSEIPNQPRPE